MPPETLGFLGRAAGGFARGQEFMQRLKQQQEETKLRKALIDAQVGLTQLKTAEMLQRLNTDPVDALRQGLQLFQQATGNQGRQLTGPEAQGGPPQGVPLGTLQQQTRQRPRGLPSVPQLSVTVDENGQPTFTVRQQFIQPKEGEVTLDVGGQSIRFSRQFDPLSGEVRLVPLGPGPLSEQQQRVQQITDALNIPRNHPQRQQFENQVALALQAGGEIGQNLLNQLKTQAANIGAAGPSLDIEAAQKRKQERGIETVGKRKEAQVSAEIAANVRSIEPILTRLEEMSEILFTAESPGERALQTPGAFFGVVSQSNEAAVVYRGLKEAVLAQIVRAFGDRGRLSDFDIERARKALPKFFPVPDTQGVARRKLRELRNLIAELSKRKDNSIPADKRFESIEIFSIRPE